MDDQLPVAPFWIPTILRDKHAAQYVSGIAYHWYATNYLARLSQDMLAGWYPDFFWLSTEACEGYRLKFDPGNYGKTLKIPSSTCFYHRKSYSWFLGKS